MTQKSINTNIFTFFTKTSKTYNKIFVYLAGFCIAILFITYLSNNPLGDSTAGMIAQKVDPSFNCETTNANKEILPDFTTLKTITQIGTISFDSDLYHSSYGKNGIPAIISPQFSNISSIKNCLKDEDEVIIVQYNDVTKIYPLRILSHHLVVNDTFKGYPILITYSNLSGTYNVFDRTIKEEMLTFGVSGEVYKNNDLIFDSKTESLWSQFDGIAKIGSLTNASLTKIPFEIMPFSRAETNYPNALILTFLTGFNIKYNVLDYGDFSKETQVLTGLKNFNNSFPTKTKVIIFSDNNQQYAFNKNDLINQTEKVYKSQGNIFIVKNDQGLISVTAKNKALEVAQGYWYVWQDFNPNIIGLQ
ncbi:MAG: DUF3179 domain-containing (seleno)protein [bacterium]